MVDNTISTVNLSQLIVSNANGVSSLSPGLPEQSGGYPGLSLPGVFKPVRLVSMLERAGVTESGGQDYF